MWGREFLLGSVRHGARPCELDAGHHLSTSAYLEFYAGGSNEVAGDALAEKKFSTPHRAAPPPVLDQEAAKMLHPVDPSGSGSRVSRPQDCAATIAHTTRG
jgi:hypothetical protein